MKNRDPRSMILRRDRYQDAGGSMPDDPSSESIRARLLRNDKDAWAVVDKMMPRARAAIRRKFGLDSRFISAEDDADSARRTIIRRLAENLLDFDDWDELESLLVLVAYRKRIDRLRKTKAEIAREVRYQADKERDAIDAKNSGELTRAMDEFLDRLSDALEDETERLVFQGKLNGFREEEIAGMVESETLKRMTKYMVRETWRELRDRFRCLFPELPDSLIE